MGRQRYTHVYRCECGWTYKSPMKVGYVQCPNHLHYPRLASKSVEAPFSHTIDREAQ